jgi:xylan 1,4-beta-xylosidase
MITAATKSVTWLIVLFAIQDLMIQKQVLLGADDSQTVRTISADLQKVKGPHCQVFRECIGAGRAAEGLRATWQRQLKMCQDEIGFKYIRFHGLLHDEMGVYSETKDGQPRYHWQYIDDLFDQLLNVGVRPFVELSFMPKALASGGQSMFWWRANVTSPKSFERWDALITALSEHWTERYGADEVKQWYFEVWNEPDYPAFFAPKDSSRRRDEYFELYSHTAKAIKQVNGSYRVGGPASSGTDWIKPFIEYAASNAVPLDFISFHAYGLGNGPGGVDESGEKLFYLSKNLHAPAEIASKQRVVVDGTERSGLPIHITEWSSSYSSRDPVHDAYFSAPYILEQFKHSEHGISSMSYWVFTDIFEELGPPTIPFHGGFGLLTEGGIKKPAYFAFQFLNRLGPTELENADSCSWVCRDEHGNAQLLIWDLTHPTDGEIADQTYFRQIHPPKSKGSVSIRLTGVTPGDYQLSLWQVGFEKNDAYSAWLEMGSPAQLSREQEQDLHTASSGKPEFVSLVKVAADGHFEQSLPMRENDVLLLTLTRQ